MVLMGWQPTGKVSSGISLRASSPAPGIPHNLSTLSQTKSRRRRKRMKEGGESKLHLGCRVSADPYTTALAFEGWGARKKQAGCV